LKRIVSLLASGTEIVDALGLGDRLVGISHECDFPETLLDLPRASRPRFDPEGLSSGEIDHAVRAAMLEHGSVYAIDGALIESLAPDIILTQAVCEVCAVPTGGVERELEARGLVADVVSLDAHTIEQILGSIAQVGEAAETPDRARQAIAGLRTRLDRVATAVAGARRPRVLAIEWLDPPFTPGHWVPEMVELAGGDNLAGLAGRPSAQVGWEDLEGLDPDVLVIMPCGYGVDAARADADANTDRLARVAPRAIDEGRAWVVDASAYFNRSGPRFVTGVEIVAGLFHPERFDAPADDRARRWGPG
jgi:iron complex transport system substrate-binding protein